MKILHTSDWHLGRYFHHVSLLDDQAQLLDQLLAMMLDNKVDVLLVAGDIYDRSVPPVQAIELLDQFLDRVCIEHQIDTILIPGNHDSGQRLQFGARHMQHSRLHILADLRAVAEPVRLERGGQTVAFYGLPYVDLHTINSLFEQEFKQTGQAYQYMLERMAIDWQSPERKVLISHCFVAGGEESESERPLSVGGSDQIPATIFEPFDYVALGHLHKPQKRLHERIRYSGSLLKYSFSEHLHQKSAVLVELGPDGQLGHQRLPLKAQRDVRVVEGRFEQVLEQARVDPRRDDYLMVRLADTQALLDPVSQLREFYPNILHLEKPLARGALEQVSSAQVLRRQAQDMFSDFFTQITGDPLSDAQQTHLQEVILRAQQSGQQSEGEH